MKTIKILTLIYAIFALSCNLFGQQEASLKITTKVIGGFSGEAVKGATAIIKEKDNGDTIVTMKKSAAYEWRGNQNPILQVTLSGDIPRRQGNYLIVGIAEGYDTVYQDLKIDKVGNREFIKEVPPLVFYPKANKLEEVTVSATKVKFYVKGDTIVYNADAFNIAEGSMLDGLIKQLPGVELKEGGEILVNGKKVESLLLNGEHFFQGNRNLMLNNLAAYTVKNIEVYDRWSERSRLSGRNLGDGQYVMDVKLKKEYMSGWMGNIEGGYGTANRYLGRMFGMWYTSRARITLIGNANNLNDSRTPGQNDGWQLNQNPGDLRTQMVGVNYNFSPDAGNDLWSFYGNTVFNKVRDNRISSTYRTNFLPGGDTYQTIYGNSLSHNLDLNTKNTFDWRPNNIFFSVDQNFQYKNNDYESNSLSGTFQDETKNLTEELLNQVYSGQPTSLSDIAINTSLSRALNNGTTIDAGGALYSSFKIPHTPDQISVSANGNYTNNRSDAFNKYGINYNMDGTKSEVNQYIDNHPDRNWTLRGVLSYSYVFGEKSSATFNFGYTHNDNTKDSYLYDLDRLEDAGIFGVIPKDYLLGYNPDQSYLSREKSDRYGVTINVLKPAGDNGMGLSFQILPSISIEHRTLNYVQGIQDENVGKTDLNIKFTNTYISYRWGNTTLRLRFERDVTPAPLNRMIDITDSRNPLYIYAGSSNLKNSASNSLTFQWDKNMQMIKPSRHSWFNTMTINFTFFNNALTSGYSFDRETGVSTYKIFNVNGNYRLNLRNSFYHDIGPRNQFNITGTSNINFLKESDMMASESMLFQKTAVNNLSLGQSLKLAWKLGKQQLSLIGDITWRNTRGNNTSFTSFSAMNTKYGLSGQFTLPKGFSISTDINAYSRSGYTESYLNTTDIIWNARLSYAPKGGKWLFMLDGFDLLHQLTNVTYNVNAVGRTESYINVLPRYLLFHIQYRFLKQPKKK